jgi:hypothetical protein
MNIPKFQGMNKNVWYLQFEGSEFGPLTVSEALVVVKSGKLKGELYAWTPGFVAWKPITEVKELTELNGQIKRIGSPSDRRSSTRVALLASVRYDNGLMTQAGGQIFPGICRDISEGGIQILGQSFGGGSLVHMEVSPMNNDEIKPFETFGTVRKLLPNNQGFSVQFKALPETAREQIAKYSAKQRTKN